MRLLTMAAVTLAAGALGATGVIAQTTNSDDATANTAAPAAAPAAAPVTSASVTDAEVTQYATAALAVQKIEDDKTLAPADMQPKLKAVVKDSGLTPARFNALTEASRADTALQKRIQTAAHKQMQAALDAEKATKAK